MAEANPLAGRAPAIFLGERQTHLAPADPPTAKRTKCRDAIQYRHRLPVAQAQTPPIKFSLRQVAHNLPLPLGFLVTPAEPGALIRPNGRTSKLAHGAANLIVAGVFGSACSAF
ncbi:hypothetical protein H102_07182 [Trichophyton rubrum CBS 100081]|nr:hypothetical protein H102_07182 [Trichophyton rubrum CBS 100081]EZF59870.1 hypothetical protein H104_07159 [Trichophyton rubrum CBS 289.86]